MNNRVINWLLEDTQPALKYRTLTELLDKPEDNEEVKSIYKKILEQKEITRIFYIMDESGVWKHDSSSYGIHTSLQYINALAENGIKKDKRFDNAYMRK